MDELIKCEYQKVCGGCSLLHYTYKKSLEYKLNKVNELFRKEKINFVVKEIVGSPDICAYRNKIIIGFKNLKGKIIAGFYEEGSHRIVDMTKCVMHSDIQNKIFNDFLNIIKKMHLEIYDEDKRTGLIRYLLIREAFKTNQVMVVIVTSSDIFPGCNNLVKELRRLNPEITTIIQNVNTRKTSIVLGDKIKVLYGSGFIYDYIGDIKFKLGPKSFFQVNPKQAYNLYNEVLLMASLKECEAVIDAYSGVATISAFLSSHSKQVIAIENNKEACNYAIANLKDNNIRNVKVINEDATAYLENESKLKHSYDVVILDPPRSGSTLEFINSVRRVNAKKVIYVSCGPDTLARDLKQFISLGYKIKGGKCFDMFCFSEHIESIISLELKNDSMS